jgi:hypothetical protein
MQVASILVAGGGSFALMKGPFPMPLFFIAGTLIYMGTIVLEGVSMSLCSKVIRRCTACVLHAAITAEEELKVCDKGHVDVYRQLWPQRLSHSL